MSHPRSGWRFESYLRCAIWIAAVALTAGCGGSKRSHDGGAGDALGSDAAAADRPDQDQPDRNDAAPGESSSDATNDDVPSDQADDVPSDHADAAPADLLDGAAPDGAAPDGAAPDGAAPDADSGCPAQMARIDAFCVDRHEAYLVELGDGGAELPHSPYATAEGLQVRAKVAAGVVPQGYVSQVTAQAACAAAGKRLCAASELATACRGSDPNVFYPYGGTTRQPLACNEGQGSPLPMFFGTDATQWTYADLNDPRLNQWAGGLAPTGSFPACVSPFGVYDCVGNLDEWDGDPADSNGHGRFHGGSYSDAELNGPGCRYVTTAHEPTYHDYSTGFRCCADAS